VKLTGSWQAALKTSHVFGALPETGASDNTSREKTSNKRKRIWVRFICPPLFIINFKSNIDGQGCSRSLKITPAHRFDVTLKDEGLLSQTAAKIIRHTLYFAASPAFGADSGANYTCARIHPNNMKSGRIELVTMIARIITRSTGKSISFVPISVGLI
jgi:hypothetical protein